MTSLSDQARTAWTLPVLATALALCEPAAAQMNMPMYNEYPQSFYVPSVDETSEGVEGDDEIGDSPYYDSGSFDGTSGYRPSLERRRANLARFVERARAEDPARAERLAAFFASTDVIEAYDREMREVGLSAGDVADAFAVWWVTAWAGAQGRVADLTDESMLAVRRQTAEGIFASDFITGASEAFKQEMAETLIVQSMLIVSNVREARERRSGMIQVQAAVRDAAADFGFDLDSMDLTPDGFRFRE